VHFGGAFISLARPLAPDIVGAIVASIALRAAGFFREVLLAIEA
jgi:hypothetical protein